jgi:hypothetical protein
MAIEIADLPPIKNGGSFQYFPVRYVNVYQRVAMENEWFEK